MNNVVDFQQFKENNTPHLSGNARCIGCHHEWVAVAPVGVDVLQCPNCEAYKGIFCQLVWRENIDHLRCNCGNFFFSVTLSGIYCPHCGSWQNFDDPLDAG